MFNHVRKPTSADVDGWAANFDGSTAVPMSTTKAFADRIVALNVSVAELEAERSASGGWVRTTPRPKPTYLVSDLREGQEHGLFIIDLALDMRTASELSESPDRDAFQNHVEKHAGDAAVAWLSEWQSDQSGKGGGMATCQHGLNSLGCRTCHGGEGEV